MTQTSFAFPYAVDFVLFDRFVDVLYRAGYGPTSDVYAKLGAYDPSAKSAVKGMAEFLGIAKSEGGAVSLTPIGIDYATTSPENRVLWLRGHLPLEYLELLDWLTNQKNGAATTSSVVAYLSTRYTGVSNNVLVLAVRTWANLMERAHLLRYQKGAQSGFFATPISKQVTQTMNRPTLINTIKPQQESGVSLQLFFGDEKFQWRIKSGADWTVVDSVMKAYRENWEKLHLRKSSNQDGK